MRGNGTEKTEAVIFDKDGTLVDFDAFWVSLSEVATRDVLQRLGQREELLWDVLEAFGVHCGETDINSVLCKGTYTEMAEIFSAILEKNGYRISSDALEILLREAYNTHAPEGEVKATGETLRQVLLTLKKSKKLAVITTDNEQITLLCLNKLGIADLFDKIYIDDGEMAAKPDPASALDFCRSFGIKKENVVVVGDTLTDVLFARNAGIRMVGVAKSHKNRQILSEATETVIRDVSELLELLEG